MSKRFMGTRQVFGFTLAQLLKNKSNRIVFGTMFVIAALAVPVCGLLFGDAGGTGTVSSYVEVSTMEAYLSGGQVSFDTRYGVQYAYSIAVLFICVFSVTYIVRAIIEEKVSRLVETLMVSINPLALILGKILAVMVFILAVVLAFVSVFGLSYGLSSLFLDVSFIGELLDTFGVSLEVLRLGPVTIIVLMVSLVLSYLFFALIAGICGAGCANMDELESANMAAMGAILAGYLISCVAFAFEGGPAAVVLALVPMVSAFTAPVFYVFGDIGLGIVAASWLIELACIAGLLVLTARIYDQLILYKGSRLKLTRILSLAAGAKGGRKS